MPKLIITIGVSLSGKTTWANQYIKDNPNFYIVSRDIERESLFGEYRMGDKKEETIISEITKQKILALLSQGKDVVLDNTHLKQTYIDQLIRDYSYLADIEFKVFLPLTKIEIIKRNQQRFLETGKMVPEQVIHNQLKDFGQLDLNKYIDIIPKDNRRLDHLYTLYGDTIIFDIDGTLSYSPNRNPFDQELVYKDKIISPTSILLKTFIEKNFNIVFLSGREDRGEVRLKTEAWLLDELDVPVYKLNLYMRKEGDYRKDWIIKKEIYDKIIKPNYNVIGVFDDRKQVLDMWQREGVYTFDVGQGKNLF